MIGPRFEEKKKQNKALYVVSACSPGIQHFLSNLHNKDYKNVNFHFVAL